MTGLHYFEAKAVIQGQSTIFRGWAAETATVSDRVVSIRRVSGAEILIPLNNLLYLETLLPNDPKVPEWARECRPEAEAES